jgi:hypothetical protein
MKVGLVHHGGLTVILYPAGIPRLNTYDAVHTGGWPGMWQQMV